MRLPSRVLGGLSPNCCQATLERRKNWAAVDGRFIYFRGSTGVDVYDAETGEWRDAKGAPSTKLGRVGTSIVSVRKTETGAALDFFESGEVTPRRTVEVRGDALFDEDRYVELRSADAGAVQIGLVSPSGEFESVSSFPRASEPFAAENSVSSDVADGALSLAGLGSAADEFPSRWVLVHAPGDQVVPISGMSETIMRHAASTARVGGSVVIWAGAAGVAVVRADTGQVVRTAADCGTIGTEAWTITRDGEGRLSVLRLRDDVSLESMLGGGEAERLRSATDAAFRNGRW